MVLFSPIFGAPILNNMVNDAEKIGPLLIQAGIGPAIGRIALRQIAVRHAMRRPTELALHIVHAVLTKLLTGGVAAASVDAALFHYVVLGDGFLHRMWFGGAASEIADRAIDGADRSCVVQSLFTGAELSIICAPPGGPNLAGVLSGLRPPGVGVCQPAIGSESFDVDCQSRA